MKKYHLLFTVMMFLIVQVVHGQITLNLALNNRPQPWLSDWVNPVNGQMIITYMLGPALNDPSVKLKTTLLDERGIIVGISNINSARIYTLRAGVNQFSIADALQLRDSTAIHALLLLIVAFLLFASWRSFKKAKIIGGLVALAVAAFFAWFFIAFDELPGQLVTMTPYLATLIVLSFASQRLRGPAAAGFPYRRGGLK